MVVVSLLKVLDAGSIAKVILVVGFVGRGRGKTAVDLEGGVQG